MKTNFQPRRYAPRSIFTALPVILLLTALPAHHSVQAASTATLTFDVVAQVRQATKQGPAQTTRAKVLLRGERARIESSLGGQKIVMLWLRPYVYRLLPSSKSGIRYKASTPVPELRALGANWPRLMNSSSKIRAALQSRGARKTGTAKLNGVITEVYSASRWEGKNQPMKIWLRRSDALPMRLQTRSGNWNVTISWSNYRRNLSLAAALFSVPKGFRIRDAQPPRSAL